MSSESEKKLLKTIEKKIPELEIISKAEELNPYKTANPIIDDGAMPMAVAKPSDVEQLRNLIKVANEDGFCIVPVSSGAPHLKGGLKCLLPHILVDLSAWKKIPMIDRRNRVCMVEPGVTYGELLSPSSPMV
jgi:FAD/FMN-containing dehydrogenase